MRQGSASAVWETASRLAVSPVRGGHSTATIVGGLACVVVASLGLGALQRGDELAAASLVGRQVAYLGVATIAALAMAAVPYQRWRRLTPPLFVGGLILLVAVFAFEPRGGSRRWIPLGPVDLQPSELVKVAFVAAAASWLAASRATRQWRGVASLLLAAALPMGLIVREPDLGTALLFAPTTAALLFVAGGRRRCLLAVGTVGLVLLPLLWTQMSAEQRSRVTTLTTQVDGGPAPRGDGYHLHQSKQTLAIGGLSGEPIEELLVREPLSYHLPAARTDFIACLVGQRFGLQGTVALLAAFATLAASGCRIAASTRDPFGRLLAAGLTTMLLSQATLNLSMTVGLMPITGVTLPLCSYGGSSLLATGVSLGLIASVARHRSDDVGATIFAWEDELTPATASRAA